MRFRKINILVFFCLLIFSMNVHAGATIAIEKALSSTFLGGLRARYSSSLLLPQGVARAEAEKSVERIVNASLILFARSSEIANNAELEKFSRETVTAYDKFFNIGFSFIDGENTNYPLKVLTEEQVIENILRDFRNLIKAGENSSHEMGNLVNYAFAVHAFVSLVHWAFTVQAESPLKVELNRIFILKRMTNYTLQIIETFSPKDAFADKKSSKPNTALGDLIANFMANKTVIGSVPRTKYVVENTLSAIIKLEYLLAREYASISSREEMELYEDLIVDTARDLFEIKLKWNLISPEEYHVFNASIPEYLHWFTELLLVDTPYSLSQNKTGKKYFLRF